jgi:hypothetical protein
VSVPTIVSVTPTGLRLIDGAVAVPALASHVRPALILAERETRRLREAAALDDVAAGGTFSSGVAGIQVWSGRWDGPGGTHGSARHLGSVDWTYDTPSRHYATIYRAMVTADGVSAGESTTTILGRVLGLAELTLEQGRIELPRPPARDPFRAGRFY